jgi:hypothetical protein
MDKAQAAIIFTAFFMIMNEEESLVATHDSAFHAFGLSARTAIVKRSVRTPQNL